MLKPIIHAYLNSISEYQLCYLEISISKILDKNVSSFFSDFFLQIKDHSCKKILIVCSHLDAIDSTGIGLLVNLQKNFAHEGVELVFADISPKILQLFEILGLLEFFSIYADTHEAVASFCAKEKRQIFQEDDFWQQKISKTKLLISTGVEGTQQHPQDLSSGISSQVSVQSEDPKYAESRRITQSVPRTSQKISNGRRTKTVVFKKRHREKRVGERDSRLFNISCNYNSRLICGQESSFNFTMSSQTKKKERNYWQVIPKFPGCVVSPPSLKFFENQLPCTFSFSVIPIAKSETPSELVIMSKSGTFRQFSLNTHTVTTKYFLLSTIGMCIFFFSLIIDLLPLPIFQASSIISQAFFYILMIFLSSPWYGLFWGIFIIMLSHVYYRRCLQPQNNSIQIHFYEKTAQN